MMKTIIHECHNSPTTNYAHRPDSGQVLVVHYTLNGHVICEAAHHLTADVNFLQIPIPVIHEMKPSSAK